MDTHCIAFRTDASTQMGTGHVMRCLTLAKKLRDAGAVITFICREHLGNVCGLIEKDGFHLVRLAMSSQLLALGDLVHSNWLGVTQEVDAKEMLVNLGTMKRYDWLIVDHYGLDVEWEVFVRPYFSKIMVIDDLADRSHDCDLLLDQNFYGEHDVRYDRLVPIQCTKLLGPRYAMLRPEFINSRFKVKQRNGELKRILVFFGGSDNDNETLKSLCAIHMMSQPKLHVDVVLGVNFPFKQSVLEFASHMHHVVCHDYVDNIAELMENSDLYIGAAGGTTWERCCLGLPSIVIAVALNQVEPMLQMERAGMVRFLGKGRDVTVDDIVNALDEIIATPSILIEMSQKTMKLVDGGGTQLCVTAILNDGDVNEK